MARRWIQKAVTSKGRGALHRQLGVPVGDRIPRELLDEAVAHPERFARGERAIRRLQRRVQLALNLRNLRRRKRRS